MSEEYRRLKFKVSPDIDPKNFEFLSNSSPKIKISFDGNGSFGYNNIETLKPLSQFDSALEQPFPPDRIDLVKIAKKQIDDLKICYDEEVESLGDLMKLKELGLIDELNLKPGRVGGMVKSMEIADYCFTHNIPCWVGGMFETGIGRSSNIRFATYLSQDAIHDLSPSNQYFSEDIVNPPLSMKNGRIDRSSSLDIQVNETLFNKYVVEKIILRNPID